MKYLEQEIDLQKLVKELRITEEDIERAALHQPKLFLDASKYRVEKLRIKSARKARLEVLKANLGIRFRKEADPKRKPTEVAINEKVVSHKKYRLLRKKLEEAVAQEEFAESLQESYRQRKEMLRLLTDIRNAEISQEIRQVRSQMAYDETREMSEKARRRAEELERD